ncbi:MAG: cytochrome c3 family protein [Acidobacteriota bacterium]|nr:cytochrome c3 family protein [Acidobacteriota bacterium]
MSKKPKGAKGTFSDIELPVARSYPRQLSRRWMLRTGALAVALVAVAVAYGQFFRGGRWASKGALSSAHAAFGADCSNCHATDARSVTDGKCSSCHEKFGDELGVYTFAAHYLYRSDDFRRLVPSAEETPCYACHVEHEGRHTEITRVGDARCEACHFASFADEHPEFDFVAEAIEDPAAIDFAHIRHVREVIKHQRLEDIEAACLYCHNAQPDGRAFESISFDRHCDSCHLTTTTSTPGLPIAGAVDDGTLGVETLEQIAERGGPTSRWVYFSNPNEFRIRGNAVVKSPLHHNDPWILDNLRRLRSMLYPDAGLADLLPVSPDAEPHEVRSLYEEAIATLEEQVIGLRGRPEPEIQAELSGITTLLERLKRQVADPFAPLDETRFALALDQKTKELEPEREREIEALIAELTQPCVQCHELKAGTIARVQKDQRVLRRAEFDHRAHIIQVRCLECHREIPIAESLEQEAASSDVTAVGDVTHAENAADRSAIQNLPGIETCRTCHASQQASDRCVTCHYFHANKSRRSDLLLYLDETLDETLDNNPKGNPDEEPTS